MVNRGGVADFQRQLYAPDRVAPTLETRRSNMAGSSGAQNESLGSVAVRTLGPVGVLLRLVSSFETISKIPVYANSRDNERKKSGERKRVSLMYRADINFQNDASLFLSFPSLSYLSISS